MCRWNFLRLVITSVCLLILLCLFSTGLRAQTFNLQTGREPIASLDGLWRFHTGDNPAWANPDFDDSQWPLLRSDQSWTKQGYPDYGGYAWYRFTIQVPDGSKPLSVLLPVIYSGYQVYANGLLIGSKGSTSPVRAPVFATEPKVFRLPTGHAGPQIIQIALRVWEYQPIASWVGGGPYTGGGGAAGDPALLTRRWNWLQHTSALLFVNIYAECILAATVGLTILALFLFRREDREYLWFAVLLLAGAADAALTISGWDWIPFLLYRLMDQVLVGMAAVAALAFFSIVLHTRRRSFWWWFACIAAALSPLAVAPYYFQWTAIGIAYAVHLCCLLPAYVWIIAALATGALRGNVPARLLLAPAALLYGWDIVESIWQIFFELGLQTKSRYLDTPLLRRPYPLRPEDVINYIFILALLIFLVRRFALARQEETRLSNELEAARSMQSLLVSVTAQNTPGFTVESVYLPASEVGGDFFQAQPGEDGSLLVVVGDVSGKGLKAAMTVSTIVGALRNEPARQPGEILAHLNRVLHGQIKGFVTCCATLIGADGAMTIANAGHLSPYRNGKELPVEGGMPLGIVADGIYDETQFQLAPGDRLTFVSDGVVEATNLKRELFGFERTQAISNQPAATIAETAKQFGQEDDITVLSIEFAGSLQEVVLA